MPSSTRSTHRALTVAVLAVAAFLAHAAWLGWDHTYQTDPATGAVSGPYATWQVVGCVVTLVVAVLVAGVVHHPWSALAVVPVVFTVAWSVPAAASDQTGLWAVGALLVLVGTAAGTAALAFPADAIARRVQA